MGLLQRQCLKIDSGRCGWKFARVARIKQARQLDSAKHRVCILSRARNVTSELFPQHCFRALMLPPRRRASPLFLLFFLFPVLDRLSTETNYIYFAFSTVLTAAYIIRKLRTNNADSQIRFEQHLPNAAHPFHTFIYVRI